MAQLDAVTNRNGESHAKPSKSLQQQAAELLDRAIIIDTLVISNSAMGGTAYAVHGIKATEAISQGMKVTTAVSNLLSSCPSCGWVNGSVHA